MTVLEHIFYLCIVYMVFNFIWWFVVQLPKTLIFGLKNNLIVDHTIKAIKTLTLTRGEDGISAKHFNIDINQEEKFADMFIEDLMDALPSPKTGGNAKFSL